MRGDWVYRTMIVLGRAVFSALRLGRQVHGAAHLDIRGSGAVIAITHFSYLDFGLTEWAVWRQNRRRMRFLVTARAFEHPLAGPLLRSMKHVPVERTAGAPSYAGAIALLRAGELVGVFPESRVHHGQVGPLKTGAVRMARDAGVPLIPVVVWGGQEVLTQGQRFSWRRAIGAPVVILAGPAIWPGDDAIAATEDLRTVLSSMTVQARGHASSRTGPAVRHD